MRTELKPCPFCGGEAVLVKVPAKEQHPDTAFVKCSSCAVHTAMWWPNPKHPDRVVRQAITDWNKRVVPDGFVFCKECIYYRADKEVCERPYEGLAHRYSEEFCSRGVHK